MKVEKIVPSPAPPEEFIIQVNRTELELLCNLLYTFGSATFTTSDGTYKFKDDNLDKVVKMRGQLLIHDASSVADYIELLDD